MVEAEGEEEEGKEAGYGAKTPFFVGESSNEDLHFRIMASFVTPFTEFIALFLFGRVIYSLTWGSNFGFILANIYTF